MRNIVVPCPVELNIRFSDNADGKVNCINGEGAQSSVRSKALNQMIAIMARNEWRHSDCPMIQIVTPYVFLADALTWLNQVPPFLDYAKPSLPDAQTGGRFPVHIWPRQLIWAFEWHGITQPLVIRCGRLRFNPRFETLDPSRSPHLVDAEFTPEVKAYTDGLSGVTNYVGRSFSLSSRASCQRPARLLVRRSNTIAKYRRGGGARR